MAWSVTVATVVCAGAATISGLVGLFAWRNRTQRMALPFFGLMATLATWSLLYGVQLGFETLAEQRAWQQVTLGVAGFVPTTWLLFSLAYTGRESWLGHSRLPVLLAEPVAFLLLCVTNRSHELVWNGAVMTASPLGPVPSLAFGPGYVAHIVYAYAAVATGIGLLVNYGTRVAPTYQKQVLLLVVGAIPPFLSHVAYTVGAGPVPALDLTPFLFAFTGTIHGLALFRFELLELAPIARTQSFAEVGDGLVVVDDDGTVVDLFGVATTVLDPTPQIGDPVADVFPDAGLDDLDGYELRTRVDGQQRTYQFQVSSLATERDRRVGTILIVRDVTGLRESRQRLSVSNRVLRHNLRNDMTVVLGHASKLESRLDGTDAEHARTIRETVEDVLELTEKVRQISRLGDGPADRDATVDAVQELRAVVEELRAEYPAADVRVDAPDALSLAGVDPDRFRLAVENVLDNAVRHNDAADPRVTITVTLAGDEARIEVADNGPGIPDVERRAIESGAESPLEHSRGLGLWLTRWCVTGWGGELRLDSDDDGTTVTITVPLSRASASPESPLGGGATR